jgi:hypothetical protein
MEPDPAEPIRTALRQYARATDPLEKLAALVKAQRATGPALAQLVTTCREHGNEWDAIGATLNLSRTAVYRQNRAGSFLAGPTEPEELTA